MASNPTTLDLFGGAGGLSWGLETAGFRCLAAFDNWAPAVESHRLNISGEASQAVLTPDIDLPESDLIVGGPPCQGFSSAGMRRGDDERNSLVGVFARLIARHRPKAFVMENVEGFLTSSGGSYVFDLLDPVIDAGYSVRLEKVNAANYGVPQHRKRVLAIGGLGWEPSFPGPTHSAYGAPGAQLAGSHLPPAPTFDEAVEGLSAAVERAPRSEASDHSYVPLKPDELERARLLGPGQRMRDLPEHLWHESYRRRAYRRVKDGTPTERRGGAPSGVRRLAGDEPSKAITGGALNEFLHPHEDRNLTIRECARLQTFPDDFVFCGTTREQIQQIGNAVPPRLAEAVGRCLREQLESNPEPYREGGLVGFVPTRSTAMSPVLAKVTRLVRERYGLAAAAKQGTLWD